MEPSTFCCMRGYSTQPGLIVYLINVIPTIPGAQDLCFILQELLELSHYTSNLAGIYWASSV